MGRPKSNGLSTVSAEVPKKVPKNIVFTTFFYDLLKYHPMRSSFREWGSFWCGRWRCLHFNRWFVTLNRDCFGTDIWLRIIYRLHFANFGIYVGLNSGRLHSGQLAPWVHYDRFDRGVIIIDLTLGLTLNGHDLDRFFE